MANNTIAQASPARQENSGTKAKSIQSYRDSVDVAHLLAVEVFDGGNDRAADVLKLCGFDKLIGGTNFASIGDVAEFYGVNLDYARTAMRRYGIGAKDLPDDVCSERFYWFTQRFGDEVQKRNCLKRSATPGTFLLYDSSSKRELVVTGDYDHRTTYISARLILMLSCFLFYGRRIPDRSTVEAVFNTLKRTSFFEAAQKKNLENSKKIFDAAHAANSGKPDGVQTALPYAPDNILSIRANGDVVMNGDIFNRLLERSSGGAREVLDTLPVVVQKVLVSTLGNMQLVAELKPKSDQNPQPEEHQPAVSAPDKAPKRKRGGGFQKLQKPENWDEVFRDWEDGKLSIPKAAKRTGMSVSSFRKYAKGKGAFSENSIR